MNQDFDRNAIIQGNRLKRENQNTPTTLAYSNGEVEPLPEKNLAATSENRKQVELGIRALDLMNDPQAARATEQWMDMFSASNPGVEFYAAKMEKDMAMMPPPPEGQA